MILVKEKVESGGWQFTTIPKLIKCSKFSLSNPLFDSADLSSISLKLISCISSADEYFFFNFITSLSYSEAQAVDEPQKLTNYILGFQQHIYLMRKG